jgi:uncharacterized protein YgfB (UPF0149 family)
VPTRPVNRVLRSCVRPRGGGTIDKFGSPGAGGPVRKLSELPDYEEIARCLGAGVGPEAAAEAHGTLCGLLCAAADDLPGAWIHNTLADAQENPRQLPVNTRRTLEALYERSLTALEGQQMTFAPLLPDDRSELPKRTSALAGWCQGFLYGLAVRGLREFSELDGEIREFLEDMVEISRAELEVEALPSEADEAAYAELVEYVRVGVQLMYETVNRGRAVTQSDLIH